MTIRNVQVLPGKYPGEAFLLTVDFSPVLMPTDRITDSHVTVTVVDGVDPSPDAVCDGASTFSRLTVSQRVAAGQSGCVYRLAFTALTLQGETHMVVVDLPLI